MLTRAIRRVGSGPGVLAGRAASKKFHCSSSDMKDGKITKYFPKHEWTPSGPKKDNSSLIPCEQNYPKLRSKPTDLDGMDGMLEAPENAKALELANMTKFIGIPTSEYMGDIKQPHPVWSKEDCDSVVITHLEPQGITPRIAYAVVWCLRRAFDIGTGYSFGFKNDACMMRRIAILETVAGIPGMIGGAIRHFRSLRKMEKDYGWIHTLLEEAENERMHLMICMSIYNPHPLVRAVITFAQAMFVPFYAIAYALSPKFCHSFVGYLEEEAVKTYTDILMHMDEGKLKSWECLAPEPARMYYHLPEGATMRDIITNIRADEAHHRELNHCLAWMGPKEVNPFPPGY